MSDRRRLYAYMYGIIENKGCRTLRINGMPDHVHILVDLHPAVALADLVKELKKCTSMWIKEENVFRTFKGWNAGYYAASISPEGAEACINYIKNQEEHHSTKNFIREAQELAMEYNLLWDQRDWN